MANELAINSRYGPGGRNCSCCGPAPEARKKHDRTVKRRVKHLVKMEIKRNVALI